MSLRAKLAPIVTAALVAAAPCTAPPALAGGWTVRDTERALVAESGGVYPDRALGDYVQSVGSRLVVAAGKSARGWRFIVLDTPDSNAFALPGQRIT